MAARRSAAIWLLGLGVAFGAWGERLPVRVFTTADGLASNQVGSVFQDRRGFYWITGGGGVSRFDGERFLRLGPDQGLPAARADGVAETRDGGLWFETASGLARLRRDALPGEPLFDVYRLGGDPLENAILGLVPDAAGLLWVGSRGRLHEGRPARGWRFAAVDLPADMTHPFVSPQLVDREGSLWLATSSALIRRLPGGGWQRYPLAARAVSGDVFVEQDRAGRLWIYTSEGLLVWWPEPAARAHPPAMPLLEGAARGPDLDRDGVRVVLPQRPGEALRVGETGSTPYFLQGAGGAVWVTVHDGLARLVDGMVQPATRGGPLAGREWAPELEDRDGNLWAGSSDHGLARIRRAGWVTYTADDGLAIDDVRAIFEDRDGEIVAVTGGAHRDLSWFDGARFVAVTPPSFAAALATSRDGQVVAQGADGDWWLATWNGLLRLRACPARDLARAPLVARYGLAEGLPDERISQVFRAPSGALWVSAVGSHAAMRLDSRTDRFVEPAGLAGLPTAQSLTEDRAGDLWASLLMMGGVVRWHPGASLRLRSAVELPPGPTTGVFVDARDRLWIGTDSGVLRVDDASGDSPRIHRYGSADGLASGRVDCFTEDKRGRIYIGGESGVDRLEPGSGRVDSFAETDGFVGGAVQACLRDRANRLWFASPNGLTRFDPAQEAPARAPNTWLSAVRVGGVSQPLPVLGVRSAGPLTLGPHPGTVQFDFLAIDPQGLGTMRFQYRLSPADANWGAPTAERSVLYAALGPGAYRFAVRAVSGQGLAGLAPASVDFEILAPIWRRWWFVAVVGLALLLLADSLYRMRMRRLVALERVRTRIASDLHDDLGASLSRISVLSEAAAQRAQEGEQAETLALIGDSARELVAGMGDIVWAIDPRRDDLANLVARLRRFASDLLSEGGAALAFAAPPASNPRLGPEQRREIYLLLKEAIHNAARHAGARHLTVRVAVTGDRLVAEVIDDGRGFAPGAEAGEGNGLRNMARRAAALGGSLDIESTPGKGTLVRLVAPLRRRRHGDGAGSGGGRE